MTYIPTFQEQLNALEHELQSLNGKFNAVTCEIAELRGFIAGLKAALPVSLPQPHPPSWFQSNPLIGPGCRPLDVSTCAPIPTTDNDEGPDAMQAAHDALTDPDDYLARGLT